MNSTNEAFANLESILTKEYEAHEQLLGVAACVNTAIKESDLPTLMTHTSRLDEQVSHVGRIEEQRQECCSALARMLGLAAQSTTRLVALIDRAPETIREKLCALYEKLKNALAKISSINVSNRILLEEGLRLVRGRIAYSTDPGSRFVQYMPGGNRREPQMRRHSLINQTI
jgi:hypothetical protein